jgi:signal transduction histidine kinase
MRLRRRLVTVSVMRFGALLWRRMTDLVVTGFFLGTQIEAWTQQGLSEPHWKVALLAAGVTLPLALYRRAPLVGPVLTFTVLAVAATVSGDLVSNTLGFLFTFLAAMWLVGLYNEPFSAFSGLFAGIVGVWYATSRFPPQDRGAGSYIFITLFGCGAWFAGYAIGHRSRQTLALRERALRLEHDRAEEAARLVAEERARIARELHDVIAHSVSVMVVQTAGVRRLLAPEQERERQALETVEQTGRQALAEMRRLLGVLRRADDRPQLAPQPGLSGIEQLLEQVRNAGLPVDLQVEGEPVDLPPGIDLAAFRIVQEALTNTLRHAGPATAHVRVRYDQSELELSVTNDGKSYTNGDEGGYGLVGMRERVALYGGKIEAGPVDGGFHVSARLPLEAAR